MVSSASCAEGSSTVRADAHSQYQACQLCHRRCPPRYTSEKAWQRLSSQREAMNITFHDLYKQRERKAAKERTARSREQDDKEASASLRRVLLCA